MSALSLRIAQMESAVGFFRVRVALYGERKRRIFIPSAPTSHFYLEKIEWTRPARSGSSDLHVESHIRHVLLRILFETLSSFHLQNFRGARLSGWHSWLAGEGGAEGSTLDLVSNINGEGL